MCLSAANVLMLVLASTMMVILLAVKDPSLIMIIMIMIIERNLLKFLSTFNFVQIFYSKKGWINFAQKSIVFQSVLTLG